MIFSIYNLIWTTLHTLERSWKGNSWACKSKMVLAFDDRDKTQSKATCTHTEKAIHCKQLYSFCSVWNRDYYHIIAGFNAYAAAYITCDFVGVQNLTCSCQRQCNGRWVTACQRSSMTMEDAYAFSAQATTTPVIINWIKRSVLLIYMLDITLVHAALLNWMIQ